MCGNVTVLAVKHLLFHLLLQASPQVVEMYQLIGQRPVSQGQICPILYPPHLHMLPQWSSQPE